MKRFDKGYIYSNLLSDLFGSLVLLLIFFYDIIIDETATAEDFIAVIPVLAIAFIVIYLCFVVYRIMYYKTSGYELTETEIKCNRGVFFKKHSVLDYRKVHAINKKQNIFHRIFGVAVLTVDSGSTNTFNQAEITIVEKEKTVDSLINKLNEFKENTARNTVNTSAKEELLLSNQDSLYSFTSKKKILYTLINIASTMFFTALFGALAITVIGVCKMVLQLDFLGTWSQYFLFAILITVSAMLFLSVFSFIAYMIRSFVGYHEFTVTKNGDNIQVSFGLLEKNTNTFSYDRIKAVKISQSLVQRMLGFASIKLEVIGYTNDLGKDNIELGVLVPFCKYDEVCEILGKVLPDYIPDKKQEKAVSVFPFVSWFLLIFGIITGVILLFATCVMMIFSVPSSVIFAVVLSLLGVGVFALIPKLASAVFSFKTNGLSINNNKITVYSGSFSKNITVFMAENLIAVENETTPLRKRRGIASYVLHLKTNAFTNEVKVHIQNDTLSEKLEKLLIL